MGGLLDFTFDTITTVRDTQKGRIMDSFPRKSGFESTKKVD